MPCAARGGWRHRLRARRRSWRGRVAPLGHPGVELLLALPMTCAGGLHEPLAVGDQQLLDPLRLGGRLPRAFGYAAAGVLEGVLHQGDHVELVDAGVAGRMGPGQRGGVHHLLYDVGAHATSSRYLGEASAEPDLEHDPRLEVDRDVRAGLRDCIQRLEERALASPAPVPPQVDDEHARLGPRRHVVGAPPDVAVDDGVALAVLGAPLRPLVPDHPRLDVSALVVDVVAVVVGGRVEHGVRHPHSSPHSLQAASRVKQYPGHASSSAVRKQPCSRQRSQSFSTAMKSCTPSDPRGLSCARAPRVRAASPPAGPTPLSPRRRFPCVPP